MKISVTYLEAFSVEALLRAGVREPDARTTTDVLVTTDTWGVHTHGVKNLRGYIRRLQGGGLRKEAVPRIVAEGPAWAMVDGDSALGMVASTFAMRTAMTKAKSAGFAFAGLRNSCHFGAAGYYASLALPEGMIGIAMANDTPTVTVPGARGAVLGSNPFAFAVPVEGEKPILLDMATSTVAGGKVFAAAAQGRRIPPNWIVDADGLPTTDPTKFPHAAALTSMAGHKGYGLALLIETLSGILTGAAVTWEVLSWAYADPSLATGHGAAFMAIDVNAMMPSERFGKRVTKMIHEIRSASKVKGVAHIYLPGEMEWERREKALSEGLDLPEDVVVRLRQLAAESKLDLAGM